MVLIKSADLSDSFLYSLQLQTFFTLVVIPPFHHVAAVWTESMDRFSPVDLQLSQAHANI